MYEFFVSYNFPDAKCGFFSSNFPRCNGGGVNFLGDIISQWRCMNQYPRNGPEDHLDLVDKMQKSLKLVQKTTSTLLKELALEEARKLKIADLQVKKKSSPRYLDSYHFVGRLD
jgi:hypothetical protein